MTEALRLADELEQTPRGYEPVTEAAAELRRLHEVNKGLMEQNTELDKKLSEWVGLTEEEVKDIVWNLPYEAGKDDVRAIEAKLKEKNT